MYWAWWLPGTPPIPRAAGMLVTMMEYRQPVAFSNAVRFWPAGGRASCGGRSSAARRASSGGPAEQVGDLGDVLVFLHDSVLVDGGLPGGGGQQPDRRPRRYLEPRRQPGL